MAILVIFKLHANATTVFAEIPLAAAHRDNRGKGHQRY
jgi:hypothetical protein